MVHSISTISNYKDSAEAFLRKIEGETETANSRKPSHRFSPPPDDDNVSMHARKLRTNSTYNQPPPKVVAEKALKEVPRLVHAWEVADVIYSLLYKMSNCIITPFISVSPSERIIPLPILSHPSHQTYVILLQPNQHCYLFRRPKPTFGVRNKAIQ
jgi:hypothetical protein